MEIMDSTLRMMGEGDQQIKLSQNQDLIALLGLTGAGKTTMSLFLTSPDSELTAVETGSGEYVITDKNNKISSPTNALISQTIFPEKMIDNATKAVFYDCPGFKDTRTSSMEIATTFFMKKILNHAKNIKLVFVVDHNSVKSTSSRTEFPDLLKHATNLIQNIDKFNNSIGMVFTKVHNSYKIVNNAPTLVDDRQTIENVVGFLKRLVATNDARFTEPMIKLVNVILTKSEDNNYTKMSLFRNPEREGPLDGMSKVKEAKENIKRMIYQNLHYAPSNETDFGYTISEQAEMDIIEMLQNITEHLTKKLTDSMEKIKQHLANEENPGHDIEYLHVKYQTASDRLTKIVGSEDTSTGFVQLFENIQQFMDGLNIPKSEQGSMDMKRLGENLRLIGVVSPKHKIDRSFQSIMDPVKSTDNLFNQLKSWFTFLMTLEGVASSHKKLRNPPSKYNEIKEKLEAVERHEIDMTGENLAEFLDEISTGNKYIFGYDLIRNVVINPVRARMLYQVLESTLTTKPNSWCYDSHKLRITALYLKISEALAAPGCPAGTRFMEIFVAKKLWIDTDVMEIGKNLNLVVVAPTWEVLGQRRIKLDGSHAPARSPDTAAHGSAGIGFGQSGRPGANGSPGLPGGNGGNFFGIADEIVNAGSLEITVDGGNGGLGQHAGNGGDGVTGEDATWSDEKFPEHQVGSDEFERHGLAGGSGGHGGRGGAGGLGGLAGNIRLLVSKSPANYKRSEKNGGIGAHGNRGLGGFNGKKGTNCYRRRERKWTLGFRTTKWNSPSCGHGDGTTIQRNEIDNTGLNFDDIQSPPAKSNPNFGYVLNDYKKFVKESGPSTPYLRISTALTDLPADYTTRNRRDTRGICSTRFGHLVCSSIQLLDLMIRKCTEVKIPQLCEDPNNDEIFVDPITLTVGFENMVAKLREHGKILDRCKDFDAISLMNKLKPWMMNNEYEEIREILLDRLKELGLVSDTDYYQEEIERLLSNYTCATVE